MSGAPGGVAVSVLAALAALPARAQEGFEFPELLSPEEAAARELQRKRNAPPALQVGPSGVSLTLAPGGSASGFREQDALFLFRRRKGHPPCGARIRAAPAAASRERWMER